MPAQLTGFPRGLVIEIRRLLSNLASSSEVRVARFYRESIPAPPLLGVVVFSNPGATGILELSGDTQEIDGLTVLPTVYLTALKEGSEEMGRYGQLIGKDKTLLASQYGALLQVNSLEECFLRLPEILWPVLLYEENNNGQGLDALLGAEIRDGLVAGRSVGPSGQDDGNLVIRLRNLTRVVCGSRYCANLARLWGRPIPGTLDPRLVFP